MEQKACHQKSEDDDHDHTQWERLLAHIEKTKEICHSFPRELPRVYRSKKKFPTGSSYVGMRNILGMSGKGIYTYPSGVIYEGEFEDGVFHGKGELRYPSGIILRGTFDNGTMVARKLIFAEGIEYEEKDWKYCKMPDRRFAIEYAKDLNPAGHSVMTAKQSSAELPPGFYDYDEAVYSAEEKAVLQPGCLTLLRSPGPHEQKWIENNCRTNPIESMGPRSCFYEEWSEPETKHLDKQPPAVGFTNPSGPETYLRFKCLKVHAMARENMPSHHQTT